MKNEMGGTILRNGRNREAYRDWWVDSRERDHLQNPGVDGRITLRWIFSEY
jgi:hypothetical protein